PVRLAECFTRPVNVASVVQTVGLSLGRLGSAAECFDGVEEFLLFDHGFHLTEPNSLRQVPGRIYPEVQSPKPPRPQSSPDSDAFSTIRMVSQPRTNIKG